MSATFQCVSESESVRSVGPYEYMNQLLVSI
jgi:hypothetical protein